MDKVLNGFMRLAIGDMIIQSVPAASSRALAVCYSRYGKGFPKVGCSTRKTAEAWRDSCARNKARVFGLALKLTGNPLLMRQWRIIVINIKKEEANKCK